MRLTSRPLDAADMHIVSEFLRRGMPLDAFLLDALDTGGIGGFLGALDGTHLAGVVLHRRNAVCAASRTSAEAAASLAQALAARERWTSVVGPETPCRAIVESFRGVEPYRVDRVQAFMTVGRGETLHAGGSGLRRAVARDLDALVPIVASYRVEDGLSRAGDDHGAWNRAHTLERIQSGCLYVIETGGRIVFTGAFNFTGRSGSGLGGIYTVPQFRGRGLATRGTADLCRIALESGPVATLHVDPRNVAAIRAYERAGLRRAGDYRLTFR